MSTLDHIIVLCIVGAICGLRILWDMFRWSYRRWMGVGRAGGEAVTLTLDGEILKEYLPVAEPYKLGHLYYDSKAEHITTDDHAV